MYIEVSLTMKHLKSLLLLVAVGASVWHVLADESEEAGSPLPTVNIGVKVDKGCHTLVELAYA